MKRNSAPIDIHPGPVHKVVDLLIEGASETLKRQFPGEWPPPKKISELPVAQVAGKSRVIMTVEIEFPLTEPGHRPHLSGAFYRIKAMLVTYNKRLGAMGTRARLHDDGRVPIFLPRDVTVGDLAMAAGHPGQFHWLHEWLFGRLIHELGHARDPGGPMAKPFQPEWRGAYLDDPVERVAFKVQVFHQCAALWDHALEEMRNHGGTKLQAFKWTLVNAEAWENAVNQGSEAAKKDILKSVYQGFVREGWLPPLPNDQGAFLSKLLAQVQDEVSER